MVQVSNTPTFYLPLTSYFSLIKRHDKVVWQVGEPFQKQTLRNRTYILSANGKLKLTVPVLHDAKITKDIRIDYSQSWLKDHIRGISSAYKHSPYFDYYFPYFEDIYLAKPSYLLDLNEPLFLLCLKILKSKTQLEISTSNEIKPENISLELEAREDGLEKYQQVFGSHFSPNLSVLDLLFNTGPDACFYI